MQVGPGGWYMGQIVPGPRPARYSHSMVAGGLLLTS
jgi:hypothetical protein